MEEALGELSPAKDGGGGGVHGEYGKLLGEFEAFHARGASGRDMDVELRDVYDINKDGRISVAELSKVLGRIGEGCSTEECERMIAYYIGFEQFKKMMALTTAPAPTPHNPKPSRSLPPTTSPRRSDPFHAWKWR